MSLYVVQSRYYAEDNGRHFGPWETGTVVDLEPDDAERINRDSAGTLVPATKAQTKAAEEARANVPKVPGSTASGPRLPFQTI